MASHTSPALPGDLARAARIVLALVPLLLFATGTWLWLSPRPAALSVVVPVEPDYGLVAPPAQPLNRQAAISVRRHPW